MKTLSYSYASIISQMDLGFTWAITVSTMIVVLMFMVVDEDSIVQRTVVAVKRYIYILIFPSRFQLMPKPLWHQ